MPNTNLEAMQSSALHMFFVLDTSASMTGSKIAMLNRAIAESVEALKEDVIKDHADVNIYVSVLEFNSNCRWVTSNGPEDLIKDFAPIDLKARGMTYTGAALKELNSKMSREAFFKGFQSGCYLPVVVFMTDGYANDNLDEGLKVIKQNKWFKNACKIGFAIGDDANADEVLKIIGENNAEALIRVNTNEIGYEDKFVKTVAYLAVRSSQITSQYSVGAGSRSAQEQVNHTISEMDMDKTKSRNENSTKKSQSTAKTPPKSSRNGDDFSDFNDPDSIACDVDSGDFDQDEFA